MQDIHGQLAKLLSPAFAALNYDCSNREAGAPDIVDR
jgi:hypothetical protein